MIVSFADRTAEAIFHGRSTRASRRLPRRLLKAAAQKLDVLNGAYSLEDLASPPGNRLEALRGKLRGWYSIRINDQWRVLFRWDSGDAHEVKIVDYH